MSRRNQYWRGFLAGVLAASAAGAGAFVTFRFSGGKSRRIVRLEKSLQIGRPVQEVFSAWLNPSTLPEMSRIIRSLRRERDRWRWRISLGGRNIAWDAKVEQFIPNQAIGWRSLSGPKHTGRITFSPLGNDTLVQVTMNYAPRGFFLRTMSMPLTRRLEGYLDQVLRDFKAALEGKGQETAVRRGPQEQAAYLASSSTGTYGSLNTSRAQNTRFGGPSNPIGASLPPEAKS
jgi:uncharacterized membrane protein